MHDSPGRNADQSWWAEHTWASGEPTPAGDERVGHTKQSCTYAIRATIRSGHADTGDTHAHWDPERRRTSRECTREEPWTETVASTSSQPLIDAFGSRERRPSSPGSDFSSSASLVNTIVLERSAQVEIAARLWSDTERMTWSGRGLAVRASQRTSQRKHALGQEWVCKPVRAARGYRRGC